MIVKADIRSRQARQIFYCFLPFAILDIRDFYSNVRLSHIYYPESTSQTTAFCSRLFSANVPFQEDRHVENYFPRDVRDLVFVLLSANPLRAQGMAIDPATCLGCHGDKISAAAFTASVHAKNGCTSCHIQLTDLSKHVRGRNQDGEGQVRAVSQEGKRRALCQCA